MVKRFVIGFLVGVGLMYYYLNHGESVQTDIEHWFQHSASTYRGDSQRRIEHEALGEHGQRR